LRFELLKSVAGGVTGERKERKSPVDPIKREKP
jgi:hypothetical protein